MVITLDYILFSLHVFFYWFLAGILNQGSAGPAQAQTDFVWLVSFLFKRPWIRSQAVKSPSSWDFQLFLKNLKSWPHSAHCPQREPSAGIECSCPWLEGQSHPLRFAVASTTPCHPAPRPRSLPFDSDHVFIGLCCFSYNSEDYCKMVCVPMLLIKPSERLSVASKSNELSFLDSLLCSTCAKC